MAFQPFLAMTAAELRNCPAVPEKISWMACHFSPYGLGLSNLPGTLPPGSILMLDDITPIRGHSPEVIAIQLEQRVRALQCAGVLLDFQRPDVEETAALAGYLSESLPCPVAVSDLYAKKNTCPVFVSAPPCHVPLKEHTAPWLGREIWLEMALSAERLTLTEGGAGITPLPFRENCEKGFADEDLHCHYRVESGQDQAAFTLWRTREDLEGLMEEAQSLGVTTGIGLYQELQTHHAGQGV